ncbi:MAG: asparagine synthase C-terminal domain-containing protein, partial [Planctomycetota bacterium]|nr:asparagine synthase C-terminal domain-containing protein [Planctomycetota bacterium]
ALLPTLGAANVFEPDFLAQVDPEGPLAMSRAVYQGADAADPLNRQLALDYKITLADNDLVKVNRSCELAGMEVSYPLMTDRLTDFAGRLPLDYKTRGRELRWFFKHALRDFLPQKVLTKSKHGFGLPFGVWLRTHKPLQDLSRDSLAALKGRGIVRPAFIDEIQRMHQTGHAGYYGVMVWTLIMLEQWFRVHEDQAVATV